MGLFQRWTFIQRTIKKISDLFQPLEKTINTIFIPALLGVKSITDLERRLLALPYRYGGLGIRNPVNTADLAYKSSAKISKELADLILSQEVNLSLLNNDLVKEAKLEVKSDNEKLIKQEEEDILKQLDTKTQKLMKAAQEKGASAWLSALPLKNMGYAISKEEFRDAVSLRYGWKINDMPKFCACGKENSLDHALSCGTGGYTIMRHNWLRDTEAKILKEVCNDVQTEPKLIPTSCELMSKNSTDGARLDVSARGLWSLGEKTMFDIRITHPTSPTYMNMEMTNIYKLHEKQKRDQYLDRVINVEKASFTPLVFSTTGGMAPECIRTNKRIATLIALKTGEKYTVMLSVIFGPDSDLLSCELV